MSTEQAAVSYEVAQAALGEHASFLLSGLALKGGVWTAMVEVVDDYGLPDWTEMRFEDGKWVLLEIESAYESYHDGAGCYCTDCTGEQPDSQEQTWAEINFSYLRQMLKSFPAAVVSEGARRMEEDWIFEYKLGEDEIRMTFEMSPPERDGAYASAVVHGCKATFALVGGPNPLEVDATVEHPFARTVAAWVVEQPWARMSPGLEALRPDVATAKRLLRDARRPNRAGARRRRAKSRRR